MSSEYLEKFGEDVSSSIDYLESLLEKNEERVLSQDSNREEPIIDPTSINPLTAEEKLA